MTKIHNQERTLVGFCAVDSGQIMLVDPCYVKDFKDGEEFEPTKGRHPFSYNGACGATLSEKMCGELAGGTACVVSSGYGDGSYPVYVTYSPDGRIASATIQFISETELRAWDPDYEGEEYD